MRDRKWETCPKGPLFIGVYKAQKVNELETHYNNMKQTILMLYTPM